MDGAASQSNEELDLSALNEALTSSSTKRRGLELFNLRQRLEDSRMQANNMRG